MKKLALIAMALVLGSCSSGKNYALAICALVDVSGTYADQKPEVVNIIKRGILPKLMPGDSLVVIRIDDHSYQKENVEADLTLDPRPSRANAQKLQFAQKLDEFARRRMRTAYTDIRGAMMLGAEYLKESGAGNRLMVVFSDMEEDLPRGAVRNLAPDEFDGVRVAAMNVKRLKHDGNNPSIYRARMAKWQQNITSHGAKKFDVVLEPEKLEELIESR